VDIAVKRRYQPEEGENTNESFRSRVTDIVQLAPTSNGELADAWGLSTGKEAWQYLTSELNDYYERNADHKIQLTQKARELVLTLKTS
jgi:Ca-activated chloride channel family protein